MLTGLGVQALLVEHFHQFVNAGLRAIHFPVSADEKLSLFGHYVPSNYQITAKHNP